MALVLVRWSRVMLHRPSNTGCALVAQTHSVRSTDQPAGGDLFNALHRGHKGNLTWHRRSANPADPLPAKPVQGLGKRIALDIARGLHFLHTHRIVGLDRICSLPRRITAR